MTLLIALQGYMIDGENFLKRSRLREDVADPLGMRLRLLDGRRKNWPACVEAGRGPLFDDWMKSVTALAATEEDQRIILIGHSDGATMALRLAVACPDIVAGVVSYAGVYDHFCRGIYGAMIQDKSLPPALFVTNEHDALSKPHNAHDLAKLWGSMGNVAQVLELPCGQKTGLRSHRWLPKEANEPIQRWVEAHLRDPTTGSSPLLTGTEQRTP